MSAPARSLVLAFHGGHGEAREFALRSGLGEAFHAFGHDIAFPQAQRHWADGRPPLEGGWEADRHFVEILAARQSKALGGAEPVPLAAIGGSNGGMFCLRLACTFRPPPAVVVAAAAAMPEALAERSTEGPPVPVMLIQATADRMIPWQGGEVPKMFGVSVGGRLLGAEESVAFWRTRNRVAGPARRKAALIGRIPARIDYWPAGPGGADLWRVVLEGASHRVLDRDPGAPLKGSLEELIARFVLWHLDRDRLIAGASARDRDGADPA